MLQQKCTLSAASAHWTMSMLFDKMDLQVNYENKCVIFKSKLTDNANYILAHTQGLPSNAFGLRHATLSTIDSRQSMVLADSTMESRDACAYESVTSSVLPCTSFFAVKVQIFNSNNTTNCIFIVRRIRWNGFPIHTIKRSNMHSSQYVKWA